MSNKNIEIRNVSWQDAEELLTSIRTRVFIEEQHVPPELEWDEHDNGCIHLLALETSSTDKGAYTSKPIGTARILADGHIGRMAVLPGWRNTGTGSALLTELINIARQQNLPQVFLYAQTTAIRFYLQHQFTVTSDEFMDAGIPHREMRLTLHSN